MTEIIENTNPEIIEEDTTKKYLDQIENLQKNSVSTDKYNSLLKENKALLEKIVSGKAEAEAAAKPEVDVDALRKQMFNPSAEMSNLDYCKGALTLRNEIIKSGGNDPFVGMGHQLTPTPEAYASAQRVADVMQQCIESCNGDSDVFTALLMSRTNDVVIPKRKK